MGPDPFFGHRLVTTRAAFHAVSELPEAVPIREPLRRWIYRLSEHRIDRAALVHCVRLRRVEEHVVSEPERGKLPLSQILGRALAEPKRQEAWLGSFVRSTPMLGEAEALLWERRGEVAARMGLPGPDDVEAPGIRGIAVAERFLARTEDCFAEIAGPSEGRWLDAALGRSAAEAFPRHLLPRTLLDLFRGTDLFRSVELDPGRLPAAYAPASFLRALLRVGAAWVDATAPRDQPFVVAHDPYGLRRRTYGALFAALPLAAPFSRRALGVDPSRMQAHLRALAGVWLVAARLAALRVLLRPHALEGRRSLRSFYEEGTHRALLSAVPAHAAGALVRLHVDDIQRFLGLLLGPSLALALEREYDDDWYRNPRAIEQLRDEARRAPDPTTTEDVATGGCDHLAELLSERIA